MNLPQSQSDRRRDMERELLGVVPSLEVVDRSLAVREGLAIDWVGFDLDGSLVLVLWSDGSRDQIVLDLIDAVAFVRSHLDVLARHWNLSAPEREAGWTGVEPIAEGDDTRVRAICLAEHFDADVRDRLRVFGGAALELFEVRTLRSERGEGAYLVPVQRAAADAAPATPRASFFDGVHEELHGLARLVMERMARVDEDVEQIEGAAAADWTFEGELLAALRVREGRLEASLPDRAAATPLYGEGDVDAFLERVLARWVRLSGLDSETWSDADERGAEDGLEDVLEEDLLDLPEIDEDPDDLGHAMLRGNLHGPDLDEIELIPVDSGPLLTREEIEAFQD